MPERVAAALFQRDRAVVLGSVAVVLGLAWGYVVIVAKSLHAMHPWTVTEFVVIFAMWAVMMVAMMLPAATPMILVFARVARSEREMRSPVPAAGAFVLGYLAMWTGVSLVAAGAQWALHAAALVSMDMVSASPWLSAGLLIAAGVYQFTPLKRTCLDRCRVPLGFLLTEWRDGSAGAFIMGIRHGAFCIGCCWLLMTLLFVAGVMSVLWIAALAVVVLAEKTVASRAGVSRLIGACAIVGGLWTLVP